MIPFDNHVDSATGLRVVQRKELGELLGIETRNKYETPFYRAHQYRDRKVLLARRDNPRLPSLLRLLGATQKSLRSVR